MSGFGLVSTKPEGGIDVDLLRLYRRDGKLSHSELQRLTDAEGAVFAELGYMDDLRVEQIYAASEGPYK